MKRLTKKQYLPVFVCVSFPPCYSKSFFAINLPHDHNEKLSPPVHMTKTHVSTVMLTDIRFDQPPMCTLPHCPSSPQGEHVFRSSQHGKVTRVFYFHDLYFLAIDKRRAVIIHLPLNG